MESQRSSAAISLSNLPFTFDNPQMSGDNTKRTSSTSTASSMPRTPSSVMWDHDEWRESRYLPLIESGAFQPSECSGESESNLTLSPSTPFNDGLIIIHDHDGAERQGGDVFYGQRLSHSRSISSPSDARISRISRSATIHTSMPVRPWPQLPPHLARALPEDVPVVPKPSDVADDSAESDSNSAAGSDSVSDSRNKLARRRHIKRPSRAQKEQPRPLPPLPATSLTHSQTTAGRFVTTPTSRPAVGTVTTYLLDHSSASTAVSPPMADVKRRTRTITSPSSSSSSLVRPLPTPLPSTGRSIPTATPVPTTASSGKQSGKRGPAPVPRLDLHNLALRSSPSEAAAVLAKTPNRTSNPTPFGRDFVPPPMPTDASARIDWDLIEDMLGADGE
ncbi:hypothetical protein FRC20_009463 [Serendipita sp. 405]|nr:hypothetical protein FRC20_009463 [Serendipita sp. 405]